MRVIDSLKVKEKLTTEIQQLKKRLQECETLKKTISGDYNNAKRSVRIVTALATAFIRLEGLGHK